MAKCKPGHRTEPYVDFANAVKVSGPGGSFAESSRYFYSPDGLKRLKKTHVAKIDDARRRVLKDETNKEEREIQLKAWGLL